MSIESNDEGSNPAIGIVDTGVANIESMIVAFRRIGVRTFRIRTSSEVTDAPGIVLPGVGRFESGMSALDRHGMIDSIRERVLIGRPTLAVCLGLQMLASGSEESPDIPGIGVFDGFVRRLPPGPVRPHLGWNRVEVEGSDGSPGVLAPGAAYFANGFALDDVPSGWSAAWSSDGGRFISALERDGVVACQFHPEISGAYGSGLLSRWTSLVGKESPCC
ncbi:MAG: imidazole glycerol phosphate synthase subunit HisH [Phycisphaera sp.]|nr:imidazole glycerol phosphate synthase subunit HisH [Phycisphaera sp.]